MKSALKNPTRRLLALSAASLLFAGSALAQGAPKEGTDYLRLAKPAPTSSQGKQEVVEFFAYSCHHCYAFEPMLEGWLKTVSKNVNFIRVPIAFRDNLVPHQRMYYALETLGKLDTLHVKAFAAIHTDKRALATGPEQAEWVATFGVNKDEYLKVYNSFSVQTKVQRATQLAEAYNVQSTPSMGVNGRFIASSATPKTLQIVDFLTTQQLAMAKK
jgi:protein dithiol oxidoreductase (disulfide-forming)